MTSQPVDKYIDSAVRAVTNKRPVPEIDFTLHTMEDGSQVSTLDRVCKGESIKLLSEEAKEMGFDHSLLATRVE